MYMVREAERHDFDFSCVPPDRVWGTPCSAGRVANGEDGDLGRETQSFGM